MKVQILLNTDSIVAIGSDISHRLCFLIGSGPSSSNLSQEYSQFSHAGPGMLGNTGAIPPQRVHDFLWLYCEVLHNKIEQQFK